jgi:hypothetical protein
MYTNHRHYILLLIACVTTVVSVLGYIVLYRMVVSSAALAATAAADEAIASQKNQYEKELTAIYSSSFNELSRIAGYVVSQEKIVEFIQSVESIETNSGAKVELSGIDSGNFAPTEANPIGSLKAHMEIEGSWKNVMRAFVMLENIPYSISLNNIRLVKDSEDRLWKMSAGLEALISK